MTDQMTGPSAVIARRDVMAAGAGAVAVVMGLSEAQAQANNQANNQAGNTKSIPIPPPSAKPGIVTVERRDGILLIGIDRAESHNWIDVPVLIGLGKAYYQLEHDDSLRVAVLHGVGANFCLGLDAPSFQAAVSAGLYPPKDPDFMHPLGFAPPFRTKPVVVAVQGGTRRGGHELFLSADIRVAASDTVFSQDEASLGLFAGGGSTVRMPREAGWGNAMRYILTGDDWDAEEARRMGLVQEVTAPGKQLDRAIELAKKVAAAAPLGVQATLTSAHKALAAEEFTSLAAIQTEIFPRILQSEDIKEAFRARREGRAPVYRGL